ncbi:MAG TPA: hypothetical protein VFY10_03190 [Dehalococcoidia bacterium]|nr:hypothetical protein [Dehalococcoidia bacterium]
MSNGVGLVLLAIGFGLVAIVFERYGVDVTVMAWAMIGVGAGGLLAWLLQPVTRWSIHHLTPRSGRHHTAGSQS